MDKRIAHIKTAFDVATSITVDWQEAYDIRIKGGRTLYDIAGQSRTGCSVYLSKFHYDKKSNQTYSIMRYIAPETEVEMVKRTK